LKSWENRIRREFKQPRTHWNLRRIILEKIDSLNVLHTKAISGIARSALRYLRDTDGVTAIYFRNILSRLFPFDPLNKLSRDQIEIYFLVAEKDLQILPYSIVAGLQSVRNKVYAISVICPSSVKERVQEKIIPLTDDMQTQITVYTDEEILKAARIEKMQFANSHSKMQILKICLSYISSGSILIVDADTLLLRERNWISGGIQISPLAQEYQTGHNNFVNQIFKDKNRTGLGFVTHHGLFNSKLVKLLVENYSGMEKLAIAIDKGIAKGWNKEFGFPSEWQLYGEYIFSQTSTPQAIPAGFVNLGISRNILSLLDFPRHSDCRFTVDRLKRAVPKLGSLSLHAYKDL
jgi:hypothetical protein